jgi:hypothetical protein
MRPLLIDSAPAPGIRLATTRAAIAGLRGALIRSGHRDRTVSAFVGRATRPFAIAVAAIVLGAGTLAA